MKLRVVSQDEPTFADLLLQRSHTLLYRQGETNYCPGCHKTHWYVGRTSAECAFCGTALPLKELQTWTSE